jgi:hypothetical protein
MTCDLWREAEGLGSHPVTEGQEQGKGQVNNQLERAEGGTAQDGGDSGAEASN